MRINNLILENFRNHKKLTMDIRNGALLIVGPNGSGKSNILEAIHLLSATKSMRARQDVEMISHDEKLSKIKADITMDDEDFELEMVIAKSDGRVNSVAKKVKINKVARSLYKFTGTLTSVLFTPRDLELFTGSPSLRRRYLDMLFFQIDREYKRDHSGFTKAVRQRNKLLEMIRNEGRGNDQLTFWNEKILNLGSKIQHKRSEFFDFALDRLSTYCKELNGESHRYEILYKKNLISEERLEKYMGAEIASKTTLLGPHRDDFEIHVDDFDIASFGSRGQKRSMILALKLCEIDYIYSKTGKRPILLLDDIFSELDQRHKDAVSKIIDLQQTIITAAELNAIDGDIDIINLGL